MADGRIPHSPHLMEHLKKQPPIVKGEKRERERDANNLCKPEGGEGKVTTLGSRIRCPIYAYDSSRPCVISSKACQKMATAKKDSYVKTDVLCKSEVSFIGSTIF